MRAQRAHSGGRDRAVGRPLAVLVVSAVLALVAASMSSARPAAAAPSDPTVTLVSWPAGDGYLVVSRSGQLWAFGSALDLGSPSDLGTAGVDLVAVAARSSSSYTGKSMAFISHINPGGYDFNQG